MLRSRPSQGSFLDESVAESWLIPLRFGRLNGGEGMYPRQGSLEVSIKEEAKQMLQSLFFLSSMKLCSLGRNPETS